MYKGKKVAFIASGGGGRGVAHGGVLKACEEKGIEFDLTIGASAGAIGLGILGNFKSADRCIDLFRRGEENKYGIEFGWKNMISMINFFSKDIRRGIFDMAGVENYFADIFPIDNFDDLEIPTYISVTNLKTDEGELFGTGMNSHVPISKVIAASCCIPLLFRPVKIGDSFYVDGEIKRPTAVNTACELGADIIIVSDVYMPHTEGLEDANMFNVAIQMVNMLFEDKSNRGIKIAKSRFPEKEIILISPPVGNVPGLGTTNWRQMVDLGYITALHEFEKCGY